jgi:hypothetical protein
MPEPHQRCFHARDDPVLLCDEARALAVRSLGIFARDGRDRGRCVNDIDLDIARRERPSRHGALRRRRRCVRPCVLPSPLPTAIDAAASAMHACQPRSFDSVRERIGMSQRANYRVAPTTGVLRLNIGGILFEFE